MFGLVAYAIKYLVCYLPDLFLPPFLTYMNEQRSGRFLLWLAKKSINSRNYLGLEIRGKLVKRANIWAKELGISNAHFIFANATVSFQQLVSSYPGPLMLVSVLVFMQSDVLDVAVDMRDQFACIKFVTH
ncbi:hypothetical protein RND81_03G164100 [Saponaria officinalis]|uniref:tRNA (guanine(46)-N(7))-methyltransferase n=1 Tax=Saponaria officinalis TaxID=3572 RepID=A0AAW1M8V0_SAPOF